MTRISESVNSPGLMLSWKSSVEVKDGVSEKYTDYTHSTDNQQMTRFNPAVILLILTQLFLHGWILVSAQPLDFFFLMAKYCTQI